MRFAVPLVDVDIDDRLLIASDGLLDVPDRGHLRSLATAEADVSQIVASLADAALETSADNVTVAMMIVEDPSPRTVSPISRTD